MQISWIFLIKISYFYFEIYMVIFYAPVYLQAPASGHCNFVYIF